MTSENKKTSQPKNDLSLNIQQLFPDQMAGIYPAQKLAEVVQVAVIKHNIQPIRNGFLSPGNNPLEKNHVKVIIEELIPQLLAWRKLATANFFHLKNLSHKKDNSEIRYKEFDRASICQEVLMLIVFYLIRKNELTELCNNNFWLLQHIASHALYLPSADTPDLLVEICDQGYLNKLSHPQQIHILHSFATNGHYPSQSHIDTLGTGNGNPAEQKECIAVLTRAHRNYWNTLVTNQLFAMGKGRAQSRASADPFPLTDLNAESKIPTGELLGESAVLRNQLNNLKELAKISQLASKDEKAAAIELSKLRESAGPNKPNSSDEEDPVESDALHQLENPQEYQFEINKISGLIVKFGFIHSEKKENSTSTPPPSEILVKKLITST